MAATSALALVALLTALPAVSGASNLSNARSQATNIVRQINRMNAQVGALGQRYDRAEIKLHRVTNVIKNTRKTVREIRGHVNRGNTQLRSDVVFAYVTNGTTQGSNPLFSKNATKVGAKNVYSTLAEGNINETIANLKNYRLELLQERGLLRAEDANARAVTRDAAKSFHTAKVVQSNLQHTLAQVKGQIANFVDQAEAAAQSASESQLQDATPTSDVPAPPPDSVANLAVIAAEKYIGVPYVWGGASRSGVDCSGLIMLAYEAAGVDLPHYSGAQYEDTERVPLWNIEPGDLLFYGPGGDEHVAMYIGDGMMIEAEETGTLVHEVPIRLGYGFVGLGRVRA